MPLLEQAASICHKLDIAIAGVITMDNTPSAMRWREPYQGFPTNYASFITCVRPLNRSPTPIDMPRKNSKNRSAGCVRLNGRWKGEPMRKPRRCAATAWQFACAD